MFSEQLLTFLIYISIQISSSIQDCQLHDSNLKDSETILLERISPLIGTVLRADEVSKTDKYHYDVAICASVFGDTKIETMKSVGATQHHDSPEKNVTLGRINHVGLVSGTNWIQLTYYWGDRDLEHCNNTNRSASIMIVCDPHVDKGDLRLLTGETSQDNMHCFYLFEFPSKYACNVKDEDDTISSGGIFCILFFTTAGLYVLGGFLYQRLIVGAKGLEQIPNYTFWRDFGNLQADGCDFLCRCGPRHESQAYRGIDDRLPKETDRDDQLLSM